jgi:DNA-binding NarL/FixJ family response regulator
MRFLVVDDDDLARFLLVRIVERAYPDALVATAACGEDGMALLGRAGERTLVVLSDFSMGPGRMDGIEFLDAVRERRPDAVRILVSGHLRDSLEPRLSAAGLHAFVEKVLGSSFALQIAAAVAGATGAKAADASRGGA